ncbi:DTW domain-containing protein [Vibrio sinensis]|uniref:tRNA-uridine aminocarboxypropyltransferase n=1 Tax=Vibrio sinensis TaxID=2302434 RepID=A0A3A6Q7P6_9VIBR|nr:DTW domain-containing protein [Vibrio sinensis]RJX65290.1 DTW domain-containing protein [Vibrio sinensis]
MSAPSSCQGCGLKFQCVCTLLPTITIPAHIALLMHENEYQRETNTGQWLAKSISTTTVHRWNRTEPCEDLLTLINNPSYVPFLLFPSDESQSVEHCQQLSKQQNAIPLFIVLDGTWQEAKKMLRKSLWLQALPQVHITPKAASTYQLRRNQGEGHLCTLEVGSEIVRALGQEKEAQQLMAFFEHYMQVYKADKSGHALDKSPR